MVDLKTEKEKYKLSKTLIETVENEYDESRYLKLLKKKGATVKFKGNLVKKSYKAKYTLKEALLKGLSNFNILLSFQKVKYIQLQAGLIQIPMESLLCPGTQCT